MNILVNENNETIIKDNIKESKEIICPNCNENILIKFNEYKINLFNCKNNHKKNNILFLIYLHFAYFQIHLVVYYLYYDYFYN